MTERRVYISFDNYFGKASLYQNLLESGQVKNGRILLFGVVSLLIVLSFEVVCEKDNRVFLRY